MGGGGGGGRGCEMIKTTAAWRDWARGKPYRSLRSIVLDLSDIPPKCSYDIETPISGLLLYCCCTGI